MRKDYFSEILKIHTDSRTEDFSSFCELHELTSDKDKHNSIFCNLADWDDSFTGLLEILVLKEDSLRGIDDEEYLSFLKVAIPSYLFWMNVLRENLNTLNKLACETEKLMLKRGAWKEQIPKIQSVGAWTNFQKHPGHILKIHHPRVVVNGNEDEIESNEFVFDCEAAQKYFSGPQKYEVQRKTELNVLTKTYTKWVIKYPDLIQLHEDILKELNVYLAELKDKISHDQTYKEWIEGLYNKPWAEIQD